MKPRRAFSLLAGVALLGAIAAYIENTRTTAQPSERAVTAVVNSAPAEPARTAVRTANAAATVESPPSAGNPLWALPLKQLSTTRERPVFSPSRRPPPPATPTYVAPVAVRQPQKPAEPERPAVTLLGTVIGEGDRIGVFLEAATGTMVRMRVGEDHQGWVLRLIKAREVTLVKDRELAVVLELPAAGEQAAPGYGGMPGIMPGGMPGIMPGAASGGMPPRGIAGGMPPGGIVGLPGGVPGGVPGAAPGAQPGRRQSGR